MVDRLAMAKAQSFSLSWPLVTGQHDVAGFVQQGPHPPVAAFRDAADIVDLSGLIASRDQAQVFADVSRSTDARRIVDRSDKGERGQLTDAWDGHEPTAGRRGPRHAPHVCVDGGDRRHHSGPRRLGQWNRLPGFNGGVNLRRPPYLLIRVPILRKDYASHHNCP
jgi:hypothetical protein